MQIVGKSCDILDEAVIRYYNLIFYPTRGSGVSKRFLKLGKKVSHTWEQDERFRGYLDTVTLRVMHSCEKYPSFNMEEQCKHNNNDESNTVCISDAFFVDEIKIDTVDRSCEGSIVSTSIWGLLRGLESFSQLVYTSPNGIAVNHCLVTF